MENAVEVKNSNRERLNRLADSAFDGIYGETVRDSGMDGEMEDTLRAVFQSGYYAGIMAAGSAKVNEQEAV